MTLSARLALWNEHPYTQPLQAKIRCPLDMGKTGSKMSLYSVVILHCSIMIVGDSSSDCSRPTSVQWWTLIDTGPATISCLMLNHSVCSFPFPLHLCFSGTRQVVIAYWRRWAPLMYRISVDVLLPYQIPSRHVTSHCQT